MSRVERCGARYSLKASYCVCVKGHPGVHADARLAERACMEASMYRYLATGEYVPYMLLGEDGYHMEEL